MDTSPTLLQRVAAEPTDQAAWSLFVDRYGPAIVGWCRDRGLNPTDCEDLCQTVLTKLVVQMRRFHYDPSRSFRGWLRMLVQNVINSAFSDGGRQLAAGGSEIDERLSSLEAREDLYGRLAEQFDLELLEAAKIAVRKRVEPQTWESYRLTAEEGLSGAEAAERLGLTVGNVYVAKRSVSRMLEEELKRLESHSPSRGKD